MQGEAESALRCRLRVPEPASPPPSTSDVSRQRWDGYVFVVMSSTQAAVVLGASGSVGKALIKELIRNGSFNPIVTLVRRSQPDPITMARGAGVEPALIPPQRRADQAPRGCPATLV